MRDLICLGFTELAVFYTVEPRTSATAALRLQYHQANKSGVHNG